MGSSEERELAVVVDGDVILNWNLTPKREPEGPTVCMSYQAGGAVLLGELITAVAGQLSKDTSTRIAVDAPKAPREACPTDGRFHHRFAIWKYQTDKDEDKTRAWRVEKDLGLERATLKPPQRAGDDGPQRADLVVLHDTALGFREHSELPWADGEERPWIVLRMAKPVADGELWNRLLEPFADRMIVVIGIDDLRRGGMHVTRELSWERTAQDLYSELLNHPQLARCAHVVVSFTTAGALVLSRPADGGGKPSCRLIFDPAVMERMWNESHSGDMIGGVTALTAGIARQVMLAPQGPDVIQGVQQGIDAIRTLDLGGYAEERRPSGGVGVAYPTELIAQELSKEEQPFAEAEVRRPSRSRSRRLPGETGDEERPWTILEDRCAGDLVPVATRIVLDGPEKALPEVPRGEFGKLLTFDRSEIEGLQSIRTLIRQYERRKDSSKPLSIAVFGPPGAGKSWSVKQVAGDVLPNLVKPITFNLSQFDDPQGLIDALHRVRDISLGGKLPLVLWDEFDTTRVPPGGPQKLGWLPHFLSPMEDGEFQDGQLTHPIGRAVFVFTGGVFKRMEELSKASQDFKDAKAPDFVSRLSGYVDVAGPNPHNDDPQSDPYYLIRRAVALRSMLHQRWDDVFGGKNGVPSIDDGVLRAFLLTKKYKHGARSLGSIIATSAVPGQDHFGRSDLPSEAQLDIHVDARDFLDLVHGADPATTRQPLAQTL